MTVIIDSCGPFLSLVMAIVLIVRRVFRIVKHDGLAIIMVRAVVNNVPWANLFNDGG